MTLCLFGGAFNPPHLTHERIIRAALEQLPIDRVVVLPAGQHPLKNPTDMPPAQTRLELCQLAFEHLDRVEVNDWEVRREQRSYTVETLLHFREYVTGGERPYWIVGSDNLKILPSWHRHHELMDLAVLVTCPRMGHPVDASTFAATGLAEHQVNELRANVLAVEPDDVSASEIREYLRLGQSSSPWLRPAVEQRIRALRLYGAEPREPDA